MWATSTLIIAGIVILIEWAIRVAAIIIIPPGRHPAAATAWLLAIFVIPELGVLLFLLIGNRRLPRKRRAKQREMDAFIRASSNIPGGRRHNPEWPPWLASVVELNSNLSSMPMADGNTLHLLPDYQGLPIRAGLSSLSEPVV